MALSDRTSSFDHCILAVHSIDEAEKMFRSIGFVVTPRGHHPTRGTQNACIMFPGGYVELLATTPDCRESFLLSFLEAGEGISALAFGPRDTAEAYSLTSAWGRSSDEPVIGHRDIEGPARVHFKVLRLLNDTLIPGRAFFCEHLDRELVYRPEWMAHDNGVENLSSITIVADPVFGLPADRAEGLGMKVTASDAHRYELLVGGVRIVVLSPAAAAASGILPPGRRPLPEIAELRFVSEDPDRFERACAAAGTPAAPVPGESAWSLSPEQAFGVRITVARKPRG